MSENERRQSADQMMRGEIPRFRCNGNCFDDHPTGPLVLYSDHTAEVADLRARIEELEAQLDQVRNH